MDTLYTNCTVIDGNGGAPVTNAELMIRRDRIVAVGQKLSRSGAENIVDLQGGYVLPGLWTVHCHLGDIWPNPDPVETAAERTIRCGRNSMDALKMGITSMRVVGESDFIDVAWRRAFAAGIFPGPTIYASGNAITATGGHLWFMRHIARADGPDEVRRVSREMLQNGADWLKIQVTAAEVACERGLNHPGEVTFTLEEIMAATDVAHSKGARVCSHTGSPAGVKRAVTGHVDCIEHGYHLDDEAVEMMVKNGTFYTPTLNVTHNDAYFAKTHMSPEQAKKAGAARKVHGESFRKAYRAGVKITCGGDNNPIGWNTLSEVNFLVQEGMTEMEAIIAATRTGADCCNRLHDVGTLEVGKLADVLVLSANPLEDIANIWKTQMVIKGGHAVDRSVPPGQKDFWDLFYND